MAMAMDGARVRGIGGGTAQGLLSFPTIVTKGARQVLPRETMSRARGAAGGHSLPLSRLPAILMAHGHGCHRPKSIGRSFRCSSAHAHFENLK